MDTKTWLDKVAYVGDSDIEDDDGKVYYSKHDKSYITRVGMEDNIQFLADREITNELTHGVGFSPKDNKWYGWSHRAIYGFEVGSTCKKGDCHYIAANEEDAIEQAIEFWSDDYRSDVAASKSGEGVISVVWKYNDKTPNKKLIGTTGGVDWIYDPEGFGRGEWVAKTMSDAYQMAKDFNEGVS